jgi:hypothetical protein
MTTESIILLKNVRLAFPQLWVPKATTGKDGKPGKPKYSANFIMAPDHPDMPKLKAIILAVAKAKWADQSEVILKGLKVQDKLCLHDGVTKAKYAGFDGNMFVSANSDSRPSVFDRHKINGQGVILAESDGRPYAGCYVNASIDVWAQDHPKHGKRVNAQLRGVQFVRDGDAFAAGTAASGDEFEDLGDQGEGEGDDASDTDPLA